MNTDYKITAINVLLNEDCILTRYYPLIPYKKNLIENLSKIGCQIKSDCMKLSDDSLLGAGLTDIEMVRLFRMFLSLYDVKPAKLKEITTVCKENKEIQAFKELYQLPGVKSTRAMLYYKAGFQSLTDIACSCLKKSLQRQKVLYEKKI